MSLAATFNYFANSVWQVPLLALCCWCALRLARASARMQYTVWIVTLLLCLVLPLRGARPEGDAGVQVSATDAVPLTGAPHRIPARSLPFYALQIKPRTRDWLAGLYLALTGVFLLRLLASHLALRRIVRASVPASLAGWQQELTDGNKVPVRLLPAGFHTPMVAGVWRPLVLLPAELLESPPQTLKAVLAHELAHVRRGDTRVNLLLRLLSTPIAFHPATVLVQRQIQHARELICDAEAASSLGSPGAYAQVLLGLAQQLIHSGGHASGATVGLFERTSKPLLEERIMTLIAPPTPLRTGSRWLRATAGIAVFSAAAATVSFVHLTPTVLAAEVSSQASGPAPQISTPAVAVRVEQPPQPSKPSAAAIQTPDVQAEVEKALKMQPEATEMRRSLEALRTQVNSPQFQRQIAEAKAQALTAGHESEAIRKQMEGLKRQMNSPEFNRQTEQARTAAAQVQADLPRLLAEANGEVRLANGQLLAAVPAQDAMRVSSGVMAGQILTKVAPVYPPDAKAAGIQGSVVLHAIIGKDGNISALDAISGPRELQPSAIDAVRQWVYKPYLLNGVPTEVETTITVTYSFGG